jgi:hypothetical protein
MINYKESYLRLAQQWQTNPLAIIRPIFFLCVCYVVHRTDFFLMWSSYPTTFWAPNGLLTFFASPFLTIVGMKIILWVLKISSLLAAVGFLFPLSATLTMGLYFLVVNYSHSYGYQGHVYMPIAVIGIPLIFSRAADTFSFDAWLFRRSERSDTLLVNNATLFNMKLVFCLVFCSAGISKVINGGSEWILSDTLRNYLLRGSLIFQDTNPYFQFFALGKWLYLHPLLCHVLAAWTILLEAFAPLALLRNKRWALFIIPHLDLTKNLILVKLWM